MPTQRDRTGIQIGSLAKVLMAILFSVFAVGVTSICCAQAPPVVQEPDSANSFSILAPDGHLEPLERQPVVVGAAKYEECFFGGRSAYRVQDEHSPVRRPASLSLSIVVRLETQGIDPATLVILYPLKVTAGQRQSPSWCGGPAAGRVLSAFHRTVQIDVSKYGEKSVKITPRRPLPPGEYAVMAQTSETLPLAFCFGIDEAK